MAAAVGSSGKALYPHCLDPWRGLKAIGPSLFAYFKAACLVDSCQVTQVKIHIVISILIQTVLGYTYISYYIPRKKFLALKLYTA